MRGLSMRWHRTKPPVEYVYHAAPECTFDSINAEGITNWGAGIYVATAPEDALWMTAWRLFDHQHQEGMVAHDEIIVWKILVASVDTGGRWRRSTDHSALLTMDSWTYSGDIPRWAILGATAYTRSSMDSVDG